MSEYIGSRIVPKPCGGWDKTKKYEVLSVVLHPDSGDSYIARKDVPAGTAITETEYWMLCSEFSAQLAALETHLTDAEAAMDKKVSDAVSEMEDAREEMSAAVEKLTEQIAENVSASTDADADYAAEVVDARTDADGEAHTSLGEAVRSIAPKLRTELLDSYGALFSGELAGYADSLFISGTNYLNGETVKYTYTASTFSGWMSMFEMPESMLVTSMTFYIHARSEDEDNGGNSVTKVRAAIAVDERNEDNDVFNETIYTSIAPGDTETVTFTVPGIFLKEGRKVYILVEADVICTIAFGTALSADEKVTWYAINGSMTRMEDITENNNLKSRIYVELGGYYADKSVSELVQEALENAEELLQGEVDDEAARMDTLLEKIAYTFDEQYGASNVQDLIPVTSPVLSYKTSVFTGWGGAIGTAQNFNTLVFEIENRESNEGYLESIRCVVAVGDKSGEVLIDETQDGFHIAPGERRVVEFRFSKTIENADGEELYAGFTCDQYISVMAGGTGVSLNAPDYGVTVYTSLGTQPTGVTTAALSSWVDIYDPELDNTVKPVLYVELLSEWYFLGEKILEQVKEVIGEETEELESRVEALEERADEAETDFSEIQESFQYEETTNILDDLLPVKSPVISYNTSTFVGWGVPIGPVQDFNALSFSIYNRDSSDDKGNDDPVTAIRCIIAVDDKEGEILIDETHTDLELAAGEKHDILFRFSQTIKNENGAKLYAAFACDQHIGVYAGSTRVNLNAPDYGRVTYLAISGDGPFTITRALSGWTNIADSTLTNTRKADVKAAWVGMRYLLGEEQQSQVAEIADERCEALRETMESEGLFSVAPRVILPDRFQAVVGDTLQLFYRGMVEHPYPYVFNIEVKCSIGKNTARYFEVTPTADQVGNYTLTVNVRNSEDTIITTAQAVLEVVAVGDAPASNVNILCIGDSLTSGGYWCAEAYRRLTAEDGSPTGLGLSNITFIGTKTNSSAGYEGYGGWTWASYLAEPSSTTLDMWVYCSHDKDSGDQHSLWEDENGNLWQMETIQTDKIKFTRYNDHTGEMPVGAGTLTHYSNADHTDAISYTETAAADGNPFWDNDSDSVSFQDYCSRNGFDGIDYVYTLLTWNGMGGYYATPDGSAIAKHVANAKTLLRILHEDYPEAKVKMMGIQMPSLNGGCGANYGANGGYSNWYGLCRTVMGMNLAYQELADDEEFSDYVEFINVSAQFDSENNMPQTSKAVNTRSSMTEMIGTNGVHPSTNGYYQIGDAAFRNMVARITG